MKSLLIAALSMILTVQTGYCEVYQFPSIIFSSPEWKNLTMEQRIRLHQIPVEIINKMTTSDLYHTFLNLPLRIDILAFDSNQMGFNEARSRYNVLSELMNRNGNFKRIHEIGGEFSRR